MVTEKLTCTVKEMADLIGVNIHTAYELVKQPDFPAVRIKRRVIVPIDSLREWLIKNAGKEVIQE